MSLEQFKAEGYTVIHDVLTAETVVRLRAGLDPHWQRLIEQGERSPFWDRGHASNAGNARSGTRGGTARVSVSNALQQVGDAMGLGELVLEYLLAQPCLDFTERVLGPYFQLDDYSIAGTPGARQGHPLPGEDRGSAVAETGEALILWHRDSFNSIQQFSYFYSGDSGAGGGGKAAGRSADSSLPPPKRYAPPLMMNQVLFLQDSKLAVIPGSHLDSVGRLQPAETRETHPAQRVVDVPAGSAILFAVDTLHSGVVNPADSQVRYLLSVHFQRAGLPSRDLPFAHECETATSALEAARLRGDTRVVRVLGGDDGQWLEAQEVEWAKVAEQERAARSAAAPRL